MLCKFANNRALLASANACVVFSQRMFTATDKEKEAGRAEWGIKYNDECLRFEKEWKQIADKINAEQRVYLEKELSETQKAKVNMLCDKLADLNVFEFRYLSAQMKERLLKTSGINPLKLNMDWPSIRQDAAGTWPPANPNWFKQQELMAQLGPFLGSMGGGGGVSSGTAAPQQQAQAEAPKEEAPKKAEVKTHYDIELVKFDAAQKIKVIKEVRAIFGLGLKEAKDLVEGVPVWLKKEVKKEEAEEIEKKLKEAGAELRLA